MNIVILTTGLGAGIQVAAMRNARHPALPAGKLFLRLAGKTLVERAD